MVVADKADKAVAVEVVAALGLVAVVDAVVPHHRRHQSQMLAIRFLSSRKRTTALICAPQGWYRGCSQGPHSIQEASRSCSRMVWLAVAPI